jgi:hypothetical protein
VKFERECARLDRRAWAHLGDDDRGVTGDGWIHCCSSDGWEESSQVGSVVSWRVECLREPTGCSRAQTKFWSTSQKMVLWPAAVNNCGEQLKIFAEGGRSERPKAGSRPPQGMGTAGAFCASRGRLWYMLYCMIIILQFWRNLLDSA